MYYVLNLKLVSVVLCYQVLSIKYIDVVSLVPFLFIICLNKLT